MYNFQYGASLIKTVPMSEKPPYSHEAAALRPCLRIRGTKRTGLSGWPGSCWQQIRIPQWTTSSSFTNASDIGITSVSMVCSLRMQCNWIKSIYWMELTLSSKTSNPTPTLHRSLLTEAALSLVSYSGPVLVLLYGSGPHSFAELQIASSKYIHSACVCKLNSKMSKVDKIDKLSF